MRPAKRSKSQQDDLHALGKAIRDIRRSQGWSQQELAGFLGISRETLGNYERGQREPGSLVVLDISRMTSVNATEIVLLNKSHRKAVVQQPAQTVSAPARLNRFQRQYDATRRFARLRRLFEVEVYSASARRWHEVHSGFFLGAVIAYEVSAFSIHYGFAIGGALGFDELSAVLSFCTMLLLLPFQVLDARKFYKWYQKEHR